MKRTKFSYSVSSGEVENFIAGNPAVREFLNKYVENGVTYREKAVGLARFFRWLRVVKGIKI